MLSEGLYRDVRRVETSTRHQLDPLAVSNNQRYSVEDLHQIKCLAEQLDCRNKWREIGNRLGRYCLSVWFYLVTCNAVSVA